MQLHGQASTVARSARPAGLKLLACAEERSCPRARSCSCSARGSYRQTSTGLICHLHVTPSIVPLSKLNLRWPAGERGTPRAGSCLQLQADLHRPHMPVACNTIHCPTQQAEVALVCRIIRPSLSRKWPGSCITRGSYRQTCTGCMCHSQRVTIPLSRLRVLACAGERSCP